MGSWQQKSGSHADAHLLQNCSRLMRGRIGRARRALGCAEGVSIESEWAVITHSLPSTSAEVANGARYAKRFVSRSLDRLVGSRWAVLASFIGGGAQNAAEASGRALLADALAGSPCSATPVALRARNAVGLCKGATRWIPRSSRTRSAVAAASGALFGAPAASGARLATRVESGTPGVAVAPWCASDAILGCGRASRCSKRSGRASSTGVVRRRAGRVAPSAGSASSAFENAGKAFLGTPGPRWAVLASLRCCRSFLATPRPRRARRAILCRRGPHGAVVAAGRAALARARPLRAPCTC